MIRRGFLKSFGAVFGVGAVAGVARANANANSKPIGIDTSKAVDGLWSQVDSRSTLASTPTILPETFKVRCGSTIIAGQLITSDAHGNARPCKPGEMAVIGRAMTGAKTGEICDMMLIASYRMR